MKDKNKQTPESPEENPSPVERSKVPYGGSNISSSLQGVSERKNDLLRSMKEAEPQVGRRPKAEGDPWPKRKRIIAGIALGLVVCVAAVALIYALAQTSDISAALL